MVNIIERPSRPKRTARLKRTPLRQAEILGHHSRQCVRLRDAYEAGFVLIEGGSDERCVVRANEELQRPCIWMSWLPFGRFHSIWGVGEEIGNRRKFVSVELEQRVNECTAVDTEDPFLSGGCH